ncbi:MAG: 16S rRNA (guanine(966)-N(2))-methyltransferase RsmD [Deltaproteobacteria bacterium]|nr:16S rRNA (guanine(966)-N(2))-methyltransferase RsmD [Deltaproteobacteria bacterium]
MRVIAGNARGQRLKAPKGNSVRPTADRVKESLFNILAHELSGARVLDLFAGTGNLAIEALSRGAAHAVLVESSKITVQWMRENIERLGLQEKATVINAPAQRALRKQAELRRQFDIIFLDPPYGEALVPKTLAQIAQDKILSASGVIVAEHSVRDKVEASYASLARSDQRRYGDTVLSFFRSNLETLSERGNLNHGQ